MAPQKEKIFELIHIKKDFPKIDKSETVSEIWVHFYDLYIELKSKRLNYLQIQSRTQLLLKLFLQVYFASDVTHYIHSLCFHCHELSARHGDIDLFT